MKKTELKKAHKHLVRAGISSDVIDYDTNLSLKLESSLSYGSYKIRGVETLFQRNGSFNQDFEVLSAGNLALASAAKAKEFKVQCTAVVPNTISEIKEKKLIEMGANLQKFEYSKIWSLAKDIGQTNRIGFLHPLRDELILGYGTIVPELLSQRPKLDSIVIPYGLGGLALGISRAVQALDLKLDIYLCELEGYCPFKRASESRTFRSDPSYTGFIEAMGMPEVISSVFGELKPRVKDVILVSEIEVEEGIRELHQKNEIKVEGAAGACFAAGKKLARFSNKSTTAILTGSNISSNLHQEIASGE